MTQEIASQIVKTEAKIKTLDPNKATDSSKLVYLQGKLRDLQGLMPKPKVKLHVAEESACLSCEG